MFLILLPRPPSVNTCFATDWRSRRRFASKKYNEWQEQCLAITQGKTFLPMECDVAVIYRYGKEKDRRKRDLFNYEKGLTDILVKMGVMKDDSQIIHGTVCWDKNIEPGWVEVTIMERDDD